MAVWSTVRVIGEHSERPWGSYDVLDAAASYKVKRLEVRPGKRLSYQRHRARAEHWFVVAGVARVTLNGEIIDLGAGQAIDIPKGSAHRIANVGAGPLVFIEVQHGDSFDEGDIERLHDDFGRAG